MEAQKGFCVAKDKTIFNLKIPFVATFFRQTTALILSLSLLSDPGFMNLSWAQISESSQHSQFSRTSKDIAALKDAFLIPQMTSGETFKGNSSFQVFLFRDLHAQEEAQMRISRAIEYLYQKMDLRHVFIEGAEGDLESSLYEAFPDGKIRSQVAKDFLKEGFLSGAEYANIRLGIENKIHLSGIEEESVYLENFMAFRETRRGYKTLENSFQQIDEKIAVLKKKFFSEDLFEADQIYESLAQANSSMDSVLTRAEALFGRLEDGRMNPHLLKKWNELSGLRSLIKDAEKLDQEKVKTELERLMKHFQNHLVKEDLKGIITLSLKYQLSQIQTLEYFSALKNIYQKNSSSQDSFHDEYPTLDQWIHLASRQNELNYEEIWEFFGQLLDEVRLDLAVQENEKEIMVFHKKWHLFRKLLQLELSREDLEDLLLQKPHILADITAFLDAHELRFPFPETSVRNVTSSAFLFYELALKRDQIMAKHVLRKMKNSVSKNPRKSVYVLITGGFHTRGIQKILEKNGVSYSVFTPQIQKETDTALYEKRMMDESYDLGKIDFSINRQILRDRMKQVQKMLSPPVLLGEAFGGLGTPLYEAKLRMLRSMVGRLPSHYGSLNGILNDWMDKIENLSLREFHLLFQALDDRKVFFKLTDLDPENILHKDITLPAVKEAYAEKFPSLVKITEMYFAKAQDASALDLDGKFKEFDRAEMDRVLAKEDFKPEELIQLLKRNHFLKRQFEFRPVVWEGYSLEEHTLRVLEQFEHYWAGKDIPPGMDRPTMRLLLALHDIGKPIAVQAGNIKKQHDFNGKIIREFLKQAGYESETIQLFIALVEDDSLGRFLTGTSIEATLLNIQKTAERLGVPAEQFLDILLIYYQADASSYVDNGGKLSPLIYVFDFDRTNRRLSFSEIYSESIEELKRRIHQPLAPLSADELARLNLESARVRALKNGLTEGLDEATDPDEIKEKVFLFLARRDALKVGFSEEAIRGKTLYEIYSMVNQELELQEKASRGAGLILKAFDLYWSRFNKITSGAKERFEKAEWPQMQKDVMERIVLYTKILNGLEFLRNVLGDQIKDKVLWERIRQEFLSAIKGRYNDDLALTTLYSVMRRIFSEDDVPIEYSDDGAAKVSAVKAREPYKKYSAGEISPELVETLLKNVPIDLPYANLEKQAGLIAEHLNVFLTEGFGSPSFDAIDILEPVFYRNKGAYIVGRIRVGKDYVPLIFSLLNKRGRLEVHAVLTNEINVNNLFTYTRSNFHVDLDNQYRELVDFLETIMPKKGRAALYSAIGFIHPAKIELIRDLRASLRKSLNKLTMATGPQEETMTVFGLRGFPYFFKVPGEIANSEGGNPVIDQYRRVHEMDRVGRILDAYHYYDLKLEKKFFSRDILDELKRKSPRGVIIDGDHVILTHVYLQRRVRPLNVYLESADSEESKRIIIEFGNCIRDLAAAGIWPGSFSLENFGVTAHGRVVIFNNSYVDSVLEHEFTQAPEAYSKTDELEQRSLFPGDNGKVVYPELISQFIPRNLRAAFRFSHGELYKYRYWQRLQEQLRKGEVPDFYPYPLDQVLEAGAAEVEKISEEPRFFTAGIKVDEVEIAGLTFARLTVPNPQAVKVLVLEPIPPTMFAEFQEKFPGANFDILLPESELRRDEEGQWKSGIQGKLAELVKGGAYDYVIGYVNENFDAAFFEEAKLQGLVLLSTATHHVDLKAASKAGTVVTNAPGPTTIPVAENLIAFALDTLYSSSVSDVESPEKWRLTQLPEGTAQEDAALAQIMWYSLMRKVLRLNELFEFGSSARYVRVGVSEGATVYHGKLGQHPADLVKMSIGIIGLDEVGLKLAELAMAHEVARIYVLDFEMTGEAGERLQAMKKAVEAVSSTEGLSIEIIPVSMDQLMVQSMFVLRTPNGYEMITRDPLTEVDIDAHELFISDTEILTQSLRGLTIGIVGLGRIGEVAAQRFLTLGANVLVYQRGHERPQYVEKSSRLGKFANALNADSDQGVKMEYADRNSFLERSNMIAVSVSLSDETRGWVNQDALRIFGTRANRPLRALLSITKDIIDEQALIPYLRAHADVHVRMDVASNEQSGNVAKRFVDEDGQALTRVKVGGHTAASVWEMRREKVNLVLMNLQALIQGETPANALNVPDKREELGDISHMSAEVKKGLSVPDERSQITESQGQKMYDLLNGKSLTWTMSNGNVTFTETEELKVLEEALGIEKEDRNAFYDELANEIQGRNKLEKKKLSGTFTLSLGDVETQLREGFVGQADQYRTLFGNHKKDHIFYINIRGLLHIREKEHRRAFFLAGISHEAVHEFLDESLQTPGSILEQLEKDLAEEDADLLLKKVHDAASFWLDFESIAFGPIINLLKSKISANYSGISAIAFTNARKYILDAVARISAEHAKSDEGPLRMLDMGSNRRDLADMLEAKNSALDVYSLDITPHPGFSHPRHITGSAEEMPLPDDYFDGVVSSFALDYMKRKEAVEEMKRVMKDGSQAVLVLHHRNSEILSDQVVKETRMAIAFLNSLLPLLESLTKPGTSLGEPYSKQLLKIAGEFKVESVGSMAMSAGYGLLKAVYDETSVGTSRQIPRPMFERLRLLEALKKDVTAKIQNLSKHLQVVSYARENPDGGIFESASEIREFFEGEGFQIVDGPQEIRVQGERGIAGWGVTVQKGSTRVNQEQTPPPERFGPFTLQEILEDLKAEEIHHRINLLIAIPGGMELLAKALRLLMEAEPTVLFQNFYFWTLAYFSLNHPLNKLFYKALTDIDPARAGMMVIDFMTLGEDLDNINPSFSVHREELARKLKELKSFFQFSETDPALLKILFEEKLKDRTFLRKPRVVYQHEGSHTYLKNEEIEFLAEIKGDTFENIGLIALKGLDDSHLSLEFPDDLIPYLENLLKDGVEIPFREKLEDEIRRRKEKSPVVSTMGLPEFKKTYKNLETQARHSEGLPDWMLKGMMIDANSKMESVVSPFGEAIIISHEGMRVLLAPNVNTVGFAAALKEIVPSIGAWHARRVPYRVIGWVKGQKIYFSNPQERSNLENYLASLKPEQLSYDLAYTRSAPLYPADVYFELSTEGRGFVYEGHDQALEKEIDHVLSRQPGPITIIDVGMGGGEFSKRLQAKYRDDSRVQLVGNEPSALMRKLAQIRLPGLKVHDYPAEKISNADFGKTSKFRDSFKIAVLEGVTTEGVMLPEQALAAFEELFKQGVDQIFATGNTPVNVDFKALTSLLNKYGYTLERSLYPENLFNLNAPKIMVVVTKKAAASKGNFSITLDGSIANDKGITNTEVSSQIKDAFTRTQSFETVDFREVQRDQPPVRSSLESFMAGGVYKKLSEEVRTAFETTRVVIFKDKVSVAQNEKGASYAHYGETQGSSLFIGQELLEYLLQHDPESFALLIQIEMNRKIYRAKYGDDARSSKTVVAASRISPTQIRHLKKSIAKAEAKNLIKKYGALETAKIIVKAAEDLQSLGELSEIDSVDLGKMRGWVLDELSSELSRIMTSVDESVADLDRSLEKLQQEKELSGRKAFIEDMLRHIRDAGEDVESVSFNILTEEMRIYGSSGKIYELNLTEESHAFLSQWGGKEVDDGKWIVIDLKRNVKNEELKNWFEDVFFVAGPAKLLEESPVSNRNVFSEEMFFGETQVLYVSRGNQPISSKSSNANLLLSSIRYFENKADKDRPIAIDSELLKGMSVEERVSFVRKHQKRLAVLDGVKIDGLSDDDNKILEKNWEIFQKLPEDYRVVIVEKSEDETVRQIPKAVLLPLTLSQVSYIEYAAVLAGYIADIGRQAARKDEKASDMLRQMIRALFEEGALSEKDLEGVSMAEILENPEKFLIPPVKTNHIEDLQSYMRAERMIQSMA